MALEAPPPSGPKLPKATGNMALCSFFLVFLIIFLSCLKGMFSFFLILIAEYLDHWTASSKVLLQHSVSVNVTFFVRLLHFAYALFSSFLNLNMGGHVSCSLVIRVIIMSSFFPSFKFYFSYQRKCFETLSTKKYVPSIVLKKLLMKDKCHIYCWILHLLMMRWISWCYFLVCTQTAPFL